MGILFDWQVATQRLAYRFNVLHFVQLVAVIEQVSQSPLHATAIPDIFTYPLGT